MKIKHILLVGLFLIGAQAVYAGTAPKFKVPSSENRHPDPGLRSAGVANFVLVTTTEAVLATDNDGDTITDGFIYYVVLGATDTLPAGSIYLELRSTDTANLTSTRLLPRIHAMETITAKRNINGIINFDPPIPFSNGLSLNLAPSTVDVDSSEPQAGVNELEFGVGVRWKRQ